MIQIQPNAKYQLYIQFTDTNWKEQQPLLYQHQLEGALTPLLLAPIGRSTNP